MILKDFLLFFFKCDFTVSEITLYLSNTYPSFLTFKSVEKQHIVSLEHTSSEILTQYTTHNHNLSLILLALTTLLTIILPFLQPC